MQQTPISARKHVAIFGNVNAGKSALFNRLLGQDIAIVSPTAGTTTDPVIKAAELIPYGAIALIDTAGLGDTSLLGSARESKTADILDRTDFAIYAADAGEFDAAAFETFAAMLDGRGRAVTGGSSVSSGGASDSAHDVTKAADGHRPPLQAIPYLVVFTKCDLASPETLAEHRLRYPTAVFVSPDAPLDELRERLSAELAKLTQDEDTIIGGLLPLGSNVVMVVPIDSAAPKGRLILPQVQLLRDCLDHEITCCVTRETTLAAALEGQSRVDLVVTDSQIFGEAARIVPSSVKLTSFSMLLANKTGRLSQLIEGVRAIERLRDGARVLMAEACTHNRTHEDIGYVKIPAGLRKKTGKQLEFDYAVGHDFPRDLSGYDLVVHCGGCMINARAIQTRLDRCRDAGVAVTNYGVLLAHLSGILDRASEIFMQ